MTGNGNARLCTMCGARLAADNSRDVCGACGRRRQALAVAAPRLDLGFWEAEPIRAALAARDVAALVRAYRADPRHREMFGPSGVTQAMLAQWIGVSAEHVARVEQGRIVVSDPRVLSGWAQALHVPSDLLPSTTAVPAPHRRAAAGAPRPVENARFGRFADRLRESMHVRGVGVVELARRVYVDRGHVSRMVNGHKLPSADVARSIDDELQAGGEIVRLADELRGAPGRPAARTTPTFTAGLSYLLPLDEAITALRTLADADGSHRLVGENGPYSEDAANAAVLDWLVGSTAPAEVQHGAPVSEADVEEIVTTTTTLDRLDRQVGGNFSRELAVKYLHDRVAPRLERPCTPGLRRELFHAASVLCEVIGYLAFDVERHQLAQRYFVQSLRLAKESDNTAYAAYVMTTLSSQALYVDCARNGLRLAQAARSSYQSNAVPAVLTEAALLEATAYATLGDRAGCTRALTDAERSFGLAASESPYWISHWDEAVFASFAGRCWLALGDAKRARPHLETAWQAAGTQPRRVAFAAAQLAQLSTLEHDSDEAARYALMTVESAQKAKSHRSNKLVRELRGSLHLWSHSPLAGEFDEKSITLLRP